MDARAGSLWQNIASVAIPRQQSSTSRWTSLISRRNCHLHLAVVVLVTVIAIVELLLVLDLIARRIELKRLKFAWDFLPFTVSYNERVRTMIAICNRGGSLEQSKDNERTVGKIRNFSRYFLPLPTESCIFTNVSYVGFFHSVIIEYPIHPCSC